MAPPKPERLLRIVALWNDTAMTQTEIGQEVGLPRGSVGRILSQARCVGMTVKRRAPSKPPLTAEQIAGAERLLRMVALWNDTGMTQTEIGREVGLPRASVGRILSQARRSGMAVTQRGPSKPPLTAEQIAWAVAARRAGRSLADVAAVLDRCIEQTCRIVKAAERGTTLRSRRQRLEREATLAAGR